LLLCGVQLNDTNASRIHFIPPTSIVPRWHGVSAARFLVWSFSALMIAWTCPAQPTTCAFLKRDTVLDEASATGIGATCQIQARDMLQATNWTTTGTTASTTTTASFAHSGVSGFTRHFHGVISMFRPGIRASDAHGQPDCWFADQPPTGHGMKRADYGGGRRRNLPRESRSNKMISPMVRWSVSATTALTAVVLTACAPQPRSTDARPRFHEAASADVVLRHYRWEHINITQPEFREDGYLVSVRGDTLGPAFERLHVRRDLAVVVLGWAYAPSDLDKLVSDWKRALYGHGFKRIVCLRAGRDKSIDGLLIIDDTKQSDDTPKQTAGS
jgi:hypothetical protein